MPAGSKVSLLEAQWVGEDTAQGSRPGRGNDWHPRKHGRSAYVESVSWSKPHRRRRLFSRTTREVGELFESHANEWRAATMFESNLERRFLQGSYQKIIGLGPDVLPWIIRDLKQGGHHWFWALTAIVGDDKADGCETAESAAAAWIAWGVEMGLVDG